MQRKPLLIGGIVLALAAIGLIAKVALTTSYTISQQASLPPSYGSAIAYSTSEALVATDTQFAAYDYASGQHRPVTPTTGSGSILTEADTVSITSDKQHILFHNTANSISTVLSGALQQKGMDSSLDYWWVYSAKTKVYQPLPDGTLLAKLHNDRVYTLTSDPNGESIRSYSLDGLQQLSSVSIVPSADFLAADNGYILQDSDGNLYFTTDGVIEHQLLTKASIVTLSSDGKQLIATQQQGKDTRLVRITVQTGAISTIAGRITNQAVWNASGLLLYNTAPTTGVQYFVYDLNTNKTTPWKFAANIKSGGKPVALLSSNTAIVSDVAGNYYVVSSKPVRSPL
jgi:sugar lactone lactonase YvrE